MGFTIFVFNLLGNLPYVNTHYIITNNTFIILDSSSAINSASLFSSFIGISLNSTDGVSFSDLINLIAFI